MNLNYLTSLTPIKSVFVKNTPDELWFILNYRDIQTISLFFKNSSIFNSPIQILDSFSTDYEKSQLNSTVYLFFSLKNSNYYNTIVLNSGQKKPLVSVEGILPAGNWLEREMNEMVGAAFLFKKDNRNLLLEYTNVFKPLLRKFPSFGYYELFFDTLKQHLVHKNTSLQL